MSHPVVHQAAAARNWCFTVNNPLSELEVPPELAQRLGYIVFQLEVGEEGTPHYQGYLQLTVKSRMTYLKRFWPTAHLEVARGTPAQCKAYCTKDETRADGPWEYGTMSAGQGARTDLQQLGDAIVGGKKVSAVAVEDPSAVIRYSRGLQALSSMVVRRQLAEHVRNPIIYVLWGDAGTGKTSLPHSLYGELSIYTFCLVPGGHCWFDGYDGEPVLIIDDFSGWVPYRTLLRWLDRYDPVQLEVKGGHTYARWERVFITSNIPPEQWYHNVDLEPLARRIDYTFHFPDEIDEARTVCTGTMYELPELSTGHV